MMRPGGMLRDEGIVNLMFMMARMFSRRAYLRKMAWLMPRMGRVSSYLGYVVLTGTRPPPDASGRTVRPVESQARV